MSFDLNKLKNLFVETTTDSNSPTNTPIPVSEPVKVEVIASKSTELDNKILESLLKTIADNNLPGEDYLEFMEALKAMQNIPLNDEMKIQTVMATLSTKGLTAAKVKESAAYYKDILAKEQNEFKTELNNQVELGIKSKEKSIATLKESIKAKTDQITALTREITEAQKSISSTEELIKVTELKIKSAQENFDKAFQFVVNQINVNISKL